MNAEYLVPDKWHKDPERKLERFMRGPVTFPLEEADGLYIYGGGFTAREYRWAWALEHSRPYDPGCDAAERIPGQIECFNKLLELKGLICDRWQKFDYLEFCRKDLEHLVIEFDVEEGWENYETFDVIREDFPGAHSYVPEITGYVKYDATPLYSLECLKSISIAILYEYVKYDLQVDLKRLKALEKYSGEAYFVENLEAAVTLKSLELRHLRKVIFKNCRI